MGSRTAQQEIGLSTEERFVLFARLVEYLEKQHEVSHHLNSQNGFASALVMLFALFDLQGDQRRLVEAFPKVEKRDLDIVDVLNAMSHIGMVSHRAILDVETPDKRLFPCLLLPQENEEAPLILLQPDDEGRLRIFDCVQRRYETVEIKDLPMGEVYLFEKINLQQKKREMSARKSAGFKWFTIVFERFGSLIKQVLLISVFVNILSLAIPVFMMTVYDRVIGAKSMETLHYLVVGILLAVGIELVLRFTRSKTIAWLGVRMDNIVNNAIFSQLLLMHSSQTESVPLPTQIARLKSFEFIRNFFTGQLFLVMVELPFIFILIGAIWLISGMLFLIPVVTVILYAILLWFFHMKLRVLIRSSANIGSEKKQFSMDSFMRLHTFRYSGIVDEYLNRYKELTSVSSLEVFKLNFMSSTIETVAHVLSMLTGVAVISFGVNRVWDMQMTVGALVATMIILWRVLAPLQTLSAMMVRLEQLRNSISQINRLMDMDVERESYGVTKPLKPTGGSIKLTNIGVRYNKGLDPVFVGLSLNARAGEAIAITGACGGGKTTLLKVVLGLYLPQVGSIQIDGIDIKHMDPIGMRQCLAYFPKHPACFEGTVRDNLLLADPIAGDAALHDALERVGGVYHEEFFKDGLDTHVGYAGSNISTDFAYRISLARVLLKEKTSCICLMDELPDTFFGGSLGEAYERCIKDYKRKKTVFYVTQHDQFLTLADRVIHMEAGARPKVLGPAEVMAQYGKKTSD
ncbi:ATP-binding cassette domain-containing protein [Alphaproteobacteria bacterium]|nr:ATP-binding cassette domain-containing protein [Alphaproteobacteria bacterium]